MVGVERLILAPQLALGDVVIAWAVYRAGMRGITTHSIRGRVAFIAEKAPAAWVGGMGLEGPGLSGRPELLVMVGAIPCWTLLYEIHNAPRALTFRMAGREEAMADLKASWERKP
jgi:hypothetical protein